MLRIEAVQKRFGAVQALDGIDFEVKAGEIFVLLGPTGAGKTTTLLTVAGLEQADAGRVLLEGRDLAGVHPSDRDLAMVFEGFNLLPPLSVRDNIAFPLRSPVYGLPEREIAQRVERIAAELHIARLLDRDVETLSGGERQRVAIARAMVRTPRAFLLDEPLSALDLKLREELRLELRRLHETRGSTILYATHDFEGAAAIADRIGICQDGKLRQTGTLDELYADPAHVQVGEALGSPAMAFFAANGDARHLRVQGAGIEIPRPAAALSEARVGLWPEVIELSPREVAGWARGRIYAVEYRGVDQAVQVAHPGGFFRKAVGLDFPGRQGDDCWFRLPPEAGFVFDPTTGDRLGGRLA